MLNKNLPTKRVVIAGSRYYNNYDEAKPFINSCLADIVKKYNIVILSGCASGADALGEHYAEEHGYELEKHPANWKLYGRGAGPVRNKEMAEQSDIVICFWDGKSKGTKSMIEYAVSLGKLVRIKQID